MNWKNFMTVFVLSLVIASSLAFAQEASIEEELEAVKKGVNTVWVLIAGFLVFFMQAGFGMVEAGFIRAKSSVNILMKNLMDFSMATIGYFAIGFALMYGAGNAYFGTEGFLLFGLPADTAGIPTSAFWFFQVVFAATAATIVAGGMAGRTKFKAYLIYSLIMSALIYPIVGHWIWGGGWLAEMGFLDFAGSTVVHAVGGWAAFVGALLLGPRIGKFNRNGSANAMPGHNIPLAALGVLILWFGWFGFNPGSTLSGMNADLIAKVAVNTNLAAAAGAIVAMLVVWGKYGKPDFSMTMNGALAGLVAITAPCAFVSPLVAITIGAVGGFIVVFGVAFLDKIHVDDPVGAVPVHGMNGIWGTAALGLFHESQGFFFGGGAGFFGVQLLGTLSVTIFVIASMFAVFKLIKFAVGLRISREEELKGIDISEHGMEAYADFETFNT